MEVIEIHECLSVNGSARYRVEIVSLDEHFLALAKV